MKNIFNSFSLLILVTIGLWMASSFLILFFIDDWTKRGAFGDLFGAVNALFSGLAFAGLLYSIFQNKKQILAQQEELLLNRKELLKSRKVQEKTEKALEEQAQHLRDTAILNGLNTLVSYFNFQIADPNVSDELREQIKEKRKEAIRDIDILIKRQHDDIY
ncbi:MAG: hypothetical protein VW262_06880 [Flavobacteriaceae bacterium]|jgi:flagellar biosynthesis component FlhA